MTQDDTPVYKETSTLTLEPDEVALVFSVKDDKTMRFKVVSSVGEITPNNISLYSLAIGLLTEAKASANRIASVGYKIIMATLDSEDTPETSDGNAYQDVVNSATHKPFVRRK